MKAVQRGDELRRHLGIFVEGRKVYTTIINIPTRGVTSIEAEEALASLIFGQVLGKKQAYYW